MPNISNWRFCRVKRGEKVPYPADWQNKPLLLSQIPPGENYGLLTGAHSGILAIDFDGAWSQTWWLQNFNISLPQTIAWSSGRPDRIQFAYSVPKGLWEHIRTCKWDNGLPKPFKEGIEFRWSGAQSVLPPSIHPDTHKPYIWVDGDEVAECPVEILEFLVAQTQPKVVATHNTPAQSITINSPELAELDTVMRAYKNCFPSLSYDQWRNTTWACITHCGHSGGIATMQVFYPEQESGEYDKLAKHYRAGTTWSIGSLIKLIQEKNPFFSLIPKHKNLKLINHVLEKLDCQ
jgi:hypothetical protein